MTGITRRVRAVGVAVVVLAACSTAHQASQTGSTRVSTTDVSPAMALAAASSPTITPPGLTTSIRSVSTAAACVDIDGWPVARQAAELIAAPALDFDINQLESTIDQGVGGILFLGNAPAPADLAARIGQANAFPGASAPLLTMADEEGGGVSRMAPLTSPLPWPRTMAQTMTTAQVRAQAETIGSQMRAAGVRLDLAPVVDLDDQAGPSATDPDGSRSFSNSPAVASAYASAFAEGLAAGGEMTTAKHFPGLGHASANTDYGPATTLPISQLDAGPLPAFAATFPSVSAVMVANASVPGLTTGPASLSAAAVNGLLRTQLGWHGLVLSDSLSAGAITATGLTVPQAAVEAIEAGDDMVLFGSGANGQQTPTAVASQTQAIVAALVGALDTRQLSSSRLADAVTNVLSSKGTTVCPHISPHFFLSDQLSPPITDHDAVYGNPWDTPIVGDWNGDGTDTIGVVRGNTFYLRNTNTSGIADQTFTFGVPGDTPIIGDWNGDGTDTIGVVRGNTFYLRNTNTSGIADQTFTFGVPGDTPIIGDWNGDGTDTIGVVRGNTFYLRNTNTSGIADQTTNYGNLGDIPLSGDWNGDHIDTIGVARVTG